MTCTISSGALDETTEGAIVLRGVISPSSLAGLETPAYQREELRDKTIDGLVKALAQNKRLPDVELAVRGDKFGCKDDGKGTYTISGHVYIVDGLQRITAGRRFQRDGGAPAIGAMLHFGTTEKWERERFDVLNLKRIRLSPNVLLRNRTVQYPTLNRLYQLSLGGSFVLGNKISWSQYMRREELLTAFTFLKVVMRLHHKFGPGGYSTIDQVCDALAQMTEKIGQEAILRNVIAFFNLIDGAFGIRDLLHKDAALHLRFAFMAALAGVFAQYPIFWSGTALRVDKDIQKKLASFPISKPNIQAVVRGASTPNVAFLSRLIIDHINSGRRTRRLKQEDPVQGATRQ